MNEPDFYMKKDRKGGCVACSRKKGSVRERESGKIPEERCTSFILRVLAQIHARIGNSRQPLSAASYLV